MFFKNLSTFIIGSYNAYKDHVNRTCQSAFPTERTMEELLGSFREMKTTIVFKTTKKTKTNDFTILKTIFFT